MKIGNALIGIALLASAGANASTVLTVTDGDVNFLFAPLAGGATLHMFDDDDNNNFAAATANLLVDVPSIVGVSGPQSGDWLASNGNGNLTLTNAPDFVLAVFDPALNGGVGAWVGDSIAEWYGNGNAVKLTFESSGVTYVVDVRPSAVPVPAAVWLFGSGLVGLAGLARRRA